jgi:Asp-tRNA(Asn)/Glu-tRNA(Gln) amidotransferase A subunit family amidase
MKSPPLIHEVAPRVRSGELSPEDLLETCLRQIDHYEDRVRAWVFVARDEAREQARELTQELKRGNYRGPLHGIPVGVKDIIDVREWPTAAGSKRWANAIARADAQVVKQLRDAGCVFVGKTVTTAFASFDPPVTRNPWDLSKTPGGSSSGSAAAVACGMCLGALATQTGGSITRPASYCGVYSLKPEYGEVSTEGVVPLAESMDHVGVMANCVVDLAICYAAMANRRFSESRFSVEDLVRSARPSKKRQLGRLRGLFEHRMESEMAERFEQFCREVGDRLEIREQPLPAAFATVPEHHFRVMGVEAAQWHQERFRRYPDDYPPKVRSLIEAGLKTPAPDYAKTKDHQNDLESELKYSADSTHMGLTPAATGPAGDRDSTGDPVMNLPWSYLGFPTISLPFGWSAAGLPLAAQLVSYRCYADELFATALELEAQIQFPRRDLPL